MTTVELKKENSKITGFIVSGHSGFKEEGEDIVCASVSSTVWCTVNGLLNIANLPVAYEARDGFVSCNLPSLSKEERDKADLLLDSMEAFLRELSEQYSDFVKVMEV